MSDQKNLDKAADSFWLDEDCDLDKVRIGFTKREAAAIALRVPESGDPDLDAMIRTAQRRDLAAMAMQGMLAEDAEAYTFEGLAVASLKTADALLSALSHPVAEKEST